MMGTGFSIDGLIENQRTKSLALWLPFLSAVL